MCASVSERADCVVDEEGMVDEEFVWGGQK